MKNFIESNLEVIEYYNKIYSKKIGSEEIINSIENEIDFPIELTQIQRFRIFLDSCLLLWNRDKFQKKYFKKMFIYQDYLDELKNDSTVIEFFKIINNKLLNNKFSEYNAFYFSYDGTVKKAWDQLAIVRNGLAHMHYQNFISLEDGPLLGFNLYNKDNGEIKDEGFVFEYIFHKFVKSFFSNYTNIGVPYKHTWFSKGSLNPNLEEGITYFYEVTYKDKNNKYVGYSDHKMNELTKKLEDINSVRKFLEDNKTDFKVEQKKLSNLLNETYLKRFISNYNIQYKDPTIVFHLTAKFILDAETEISNFLVHLGQLNDGICEFIICKKNNALNKDKKNEIIESLRELEEDKNSYITFRNLFVLLKLMNIIFRIQDEWYSKIDYKQIDMSKFEPGDWTAASTSISKFFVEGKIPQEESNFAGNYYFIERLRNSLMHGNISTSINDKSELEFIFSDIHNSRVETIRIESKYLDKFVKQKLFYEGIPNEYRIL